MTLKNIGGLDTLFVPKLSPHSASYLMIVLHGLGDSIEGYLSFPQCLNLPCLNYLLVNAPHSYGIGYSWFDIENPQQTEIDHTRKLLENLIEETRKSFPDNKMIIFGFSQGGFMALELMLKNLYHFCALIGVSTFYSTESLFKDPSLILAPKEQKILLTHGTEDQVLYLANTKKEVDNLKKLGFDITWKEYKKNHTIDLKDEIHDLRTFLKHIMN